MHVRDRRVRARETVRIQRDDPVGFQWTLDNFVNGV
jgi:hypothetical protein